MPSPPENRQVMVIDDDPFQLKMLSFLLTQIGIDRSRIHIRAGGSEALTHLDAHPHLDHLIILDLNMPDMDGVELVRILAEREFTGSLVLVSGEDRRILETAERLARARKLNVLGCLNKPVTRESLETVVRTWDAHPQGKTGRTLKVYSSEELRATFDCAQLVNMYQPKINLKTGQLCGVETLVRWQHPEHGLVFPDQFIGTIEESGLIDDLTRAVLGQALRQGQRWQDAGLHLHVAVNVSMDNLLKIEFANFVVSELERVGFPPADLILEVTESRLMTDRIAPLDILTRLRLKRVGLSIDDFGTGHSSLAQLRDLPFDELKIDRSFVHGADTNPTLRSIFEGSLNMANHLGMRVVGEGVEDIADWNFLRDSGCDLAQGYFVSRPLFADALVPWLKDWTANGPGSPVR